jgi:alcohol oxidase
VAPQGEDPQRDKVHGYQGPLKVSYGGLVTNIGTDFLSTAALYDKKRKSIDDPDNLYDVNAYAVHAFSTQKPHLINL